MTGDLEHENEQFTFLTRVSYKTLKIHYILGFSYGLWINWEMYNNNKTTIDPYTLSPVQSPSEDKWHTRRTSLYKTNPRINVGLSQGITLFSDRVV